MPQKKIVHNPFNMSFNDKAVYWHPAYLTYMQSTSNGYIFPFLLCFSLLFFSVICKASSHSHLDFGHFFFLRMVLIAVSCTMSQTSVHSTSGTLSIRSSPLICFSLPLYNHKGFDLGHT